MFIHLKIDEKEVNSVRSGHVPTLQKVLRRTLDDRIGRLIDERKELDLIQGHAQILRELLMLLDRTNVAS